MRTSCVPRNIKINTETVSQIAIKYSDAVAAKKQAAFRSDFNNWVWNQVLDRRKLDHKWRKGFNFHHKITTDGVSVSNLQKQR